MAGGAEQTLTVRSGEGEIRLILVRGSWALPAWETIIDTIELDGIPVLIPDVMGFGS